MVHIPYRGGAPALTDLIGGQVQVYFSPLPESIESIKAGRVRALAVTTATRAEALPDLPTIGEFVPGFEANTWQGIGAPKQYPPTSSSGSTGKSTRRWQTRKSGRVWADLGSMPSPMTPGEFDKYIVEETDKWAKVIRTGNIKME